MRHGFGNRKLGRTTGHRLALFRNQLASLMESERIITTLPKAKELRPLAERIVTHGKRGSVHSRRLAQRWIAKRELLKKIFDEIAPRFQDRAGGYLRIVKLGPRLGDGAEMAVLEFIDYQLPEAKPKAKKEKGKAKGEAGSAPEGEAAEVEGGEATKQGAKGNKLKAQPKKGEGKHRPEKKVRADTHAKSVKPKGPRKAGSE